MLSPSVSREDHNHNHNHNSSNEPIITFQIEEHKDEQIGNLTIETNNDSDGLDSRVQDYIFVIDTSGSMYDSMDSLKETLLSICGSFKSGQRVSIITFASNAVHQFALQPMTSISIEKLNRTVENINASGSTNYKKAFELLLKVIEEDYDKTKDMMIERNIIFISDGQPDAPYDMTIMNNNHVFQQYALYSCSYGSFVCADILKSLCVDDHYRHFETASELTTLTSLLGINSSILSQNTQIMSNCEIDPPKVIRSTDLINIPFLVTSEEEPKISLIMNDIIFEAKRITSLDKNFVIGSYLYKGYLSQLNVLKRNLESNIEGIETNFRGIESQINDDAEFLNLFKDDLLNLLENIKLSIPSLRERNYTMYNRITENIDTSSSIRSPRVSGALRLSRRMTSI